ncbi:MAG: nitrogenase iron-molybdenum cofactor biosynthesis protein NifN [Calothrix sp. FI2-JRJ7]|jgi:nitrogenase molybdenum-iron protein NifN|nr:nitrogenase iron-molybdenum cofactor biosynthesis protein NifN [Calothrix sp. FI2-JRJ7]
MAIVSITNTSVAVNPLKHSQAVGATLAFMGFAGVMPVLHGSPGCSTFAQIPLTQHLGEIIPLSTTGMTEVVTVLGCEENIKQAIISLVHQHHPEILGLCTTGLTETRGDDMARFLKEIRQLPELNNLPMVLVSTPDFKGSLQDGYAAAVESIVKEIPTVGKPNTQSKQITILASSAFTPGDIQQIKEMCLDLELDPIVLPDLSGLLDIDFNNYDSTNNSTLNRAVTRSGTTLERLQLVGNSSFTLALGESMRSSARILQQRFKVPYDVFTEFVGLDATDKLLYALFKISGNAVPEKYRIYRRQLQQAMLFTHLKLSCKKVSVALEPDLLWLTIDFLQSMGVSIHAAVTTGRSPLLEKIPIQSVTIGDLEDFEQLAAGSDLLIANSNASAIAKRLSIPLYHQGIPIFDRLGNIFATKLGYRGAMQYLFDIANEINAQI